MYLLLIDHNFGLSDELQNIIERAYSGTETVTCFTPETLLKTADKLNPEVIIVDFDMANGAVTDLFSALREKNRETYIFALIEPEFNNRLDGVLEAGGIDDYLVKPIRKEDFIARISLAKMRKGSLDKDNGEAGYPSAFEAAVSEDNSMDSEPTEEASFESDLLTGSLIEEAGPVTKNREPANGESLDIFVNICPADIENVLYRHPKILEAVVTDIKDPLLGNTLKAYIVLKDDERMSEEEVFKYLESNIADYKIPKIIDFRRELPKTLVGKVLRRANRLREENKGQQKTAYT